MQEYEIVPITEQYIDSFREAVGSVARERKYLAFLDAPSSEMAHAFVMENLKENRPHFVAISKGKVIGWCDITSLRRPVFAHSGRLGIGVLEQYRGQGIGEALIRAALEEARSKGLTRIELTVREPNKRAIALYEKMGFQVEGLHRDAICIEGEYENHISMALLFDRSDSKSGCHHNIDLAEIKLYPASLKEYSIIQNMGRFYVYDMSEYMGKEDGWEMPENGLYECIDFKKYWEVENAFPFLIRYKNQIAGFVIVNKEGSDSEIDFNMAQFFILRKFKGQGVGRYVAKQCFDKFRGKWEVMVMPENVGAYRFWRATIKNYTNDNFTEYTRDIAHFNNSRKNIFKFDSRIEPCEVDFL